ncbi:MAG TPA: putative LPS assembly protein LptD [Gemmatimonadales bacterium]|nr:putative LPS assembly protein LptD [Gemmatimonadales bacterium]
MVLLVALTPVLGAQQPVRRPPPRERERPQPAQPSPQLPAPQRARPDTAQDTARSRGNLLPQRPDRAFQAPDSITAALLTREGYRLTRYTADSVQLVADEREIRLSGRALLEQEGSQLEADTVRYVEERCTLYAAGRPRLFDPSGVLVGEGMTYDACNKTGIISHATTTFQEGSANWILRGQLAVDNEENRSYGLRATVTACELTDPHYHFAARQVKWINKRLMVARPAVLYVQDVPVLWLPFIFQDMRRGRRSGMIPPQFGINDIVRNSPSYQRHVANIGYYWAISDYSDAQVTIDWYAQRFVAVNGRLRYRWLDRFLAGGIAYQELHESGGSTSRRITWSHQQQFNVNSQLTASLDYASSSRVVSRNSVDPVLAVATIDSRLNFQRRYTWGTLNVGGSRNQSLDQPRVVTTFPTVSFTPNPIALSRSIIWSPGFTLTNSLQNNLTPGVAIPRGPGLVDTQLVDTRQTSLAIQTPLRIGRWNWTNAISMTDEWNNRRESFTIPDPQDTTRRLTRTYGEFFQTGIDWQTGINLPILLQGTWNLAPGVGIVNTTGGPYLLRNRFTGGAFVSQGKRLQLRAGIAPTFYGLFGGIGPIARLRHAVSPSLNWSYQPAATVPEEYARATVRPGQAVNRRSQASQTISIGLSQNFEAKLRPPPRPPGDTTAPPADQPPAEGRKLKLLSIQSDALTFDLEQARRPGRNAWTTDLWSNTLSSDLLRGLNVRIAHDLWDGPVGTDTARFRPYLTSVTFGLGINENTLRSIGRLLGLSTGPSRESPTARPDTAATRSPTDPGRNLNTYARGPLATQFSAVDRLTPGRGTGFQATLTYSLSRQRPDPAAATPAPANQTMNGTVTFSPTPHWSVSWQTSYNFTTGEFSDHVVRLDRDMHDWRATFTFVKSPNGNFLFSFFIQLLDQPDIKFDYDQRNIR